MFYEEYIQKRLNSAVCLLLDYYFEEEDDLKRGIHSILWEHYWRNSRKMYEQNLEYAAFQFYCDVSNAIINCCLILPVICCTQTKK